MISPSKYEKVIHLKKAKNKKMKAYHIQLHRKNKMIINKKFPKKIK